MFNECPFNASVESEGPNFHILIFYIINNFLILNIIRQKFGGKNFDLRQNKEVNYSHS